MPWFGDCMKWAKWRTDAAGILKAHRKLMRYVNSPEFKMRQLERDYGDYRVRVMIAKGTGLDHRLGGDIPDEMVKAKKAELITRRAAREHQKCA